MNQNQPQEQAHPAAVAQEFMRRTDMKGGEVEAYAQTFNWLKGFLDGSIVPTPKEAHLALLEELKELREYKRVAEGEEEKAEAEESGDLPVLDPVEDAAVEPEAPAEELEAVDSEASE